MQPATPNDAGEPRLKALALCRAFAGLSPTPTAMVEGDDHVVLYVNPAFCRLVDKSEQLLVGTPFAESLPQCQECPSLLLDVKRTGEARNHTERGNSADETFFWSYSAWPVIDDREQPLGVMIQISKSSELQSQLVDMNAALLVSAVRQHELSETARALAAEMSTEIAQRKRSEDSLTISESRLSLALESARAGTWEWNLKTDQLRWSDEINALSGSKAQSRVESYASLRAHVHAEDREAVDRVAQQAADAHSQIAVEFRVIDAGERIRWMLLRGCLNHVEDGRALSYAGIIMDVTERKQAEQALLRSEKLAGVGRLAATLAHEINNPLDAAMNALYLAAISPEVGEPARGYLALADQELRRVAHMARQSLGFYREAGSPLTFSMDSLFDSALTLLDNRILAKSITIARDRRKTVVVTGVFGELRQVMVNLLANSVDALGAHGRIQLRATYSSSPNNGGRPRVRIAVADNGNGIGALQLTHIFEPFFTTKGERGTGLGLWVTKQIVEKHGGKIAVRSSAGGNHTGTVFSITLPG